MKLTMLIVILALVPVKEYAQTIIDKTIPVKAGEIVKIHFDYPKLIHVTTWEGNEISIHGEVMINGGENDDAFVVETSQSGKEINVSASIRNIKGLPQRITVVRDGQKVMFRDKAELRKYQAQHGEVYDHMSWGPDIDIALEVKIPRNIQTHITSVYGMVEVKNFSGPLAVEATYGGVDVSLSERSIGELTAETSYGQIYTNLDIKFGENEVRTRDFHTLVTARPGQGPRYNIGSTYGNVYLRKAAGN